MHSAGVRTALLLLLAAGCRNGGTDAPAADDGRYGDPYEIVLSFQPAGPDHPPALDGDSLAVLVTYPGGCETHDFELDYEAGDGEARLWLVHDAHGDGCEALIEDELRLPVPPGAVAPQTLLLLNPNDPTPFVLRWARGGGE
jgi:hypothetical protein